MEVVLGSIVIPAAILVVTPADIVREFYYAFFVNIAGKAS
jgi:hypothetical protein